GRLAQRSFLGCSKRGWPACLGGDGSLDRRGGGPQPRSGMLEQVMSVRRIIEAFEAWRQRGESLVLASVYDTLGSTYTKPGHRILIASNGDYRGLVSGGCLEGDLAERARAVIDSGMPRAVTYDLRDDADDVWGLGVGCNGLIRVFLQPLTPDSGFEPFASIAARLLGTAG